MAHISCPKIAIVGFGIYGCRIAGGNAPLDMGVELVEGRSLAKGNIIDLIGCRLIPDRGCQEIGLDAVVDIAEITACFAVSVDKDRFIVDQPGKPFGDDCGIGPVGILTSAEYVEVAQTDGFEVVGFGKDVGVELVDHLGYGIGR